MIDVPSLRELRQRIQSFASKGPSDLGSELSESPPRRNAVIVLISRGILFLVGSFVLLAGFALMIGNMSGRFPTFPFAGYITITIGGLLLGAARIGQMDDDQDRS